MLQQADLFFGEAIEGIDEAVEGVNYIRQIIRWLSRMALT